MRNAKMEKFLLFYKKAIGAEHCIRFINEKLANPVDQEVIEIDGNAIITEYMLTVIDDEECDLKERN